MKAPLRLSAAAAAAVASLAIAQPAIESKRTGDDAYELVLRSDTITDAGEALLLLAPRAAELCGQKTPRFGHYRFSSKESVDTPSAPTGFVLTQQLRCGVGSGEITDAVPPNRKNWRPTEADQAAVERLTYDYFRALDLGRHRDAYQLFAPGVVPWEGWRDSAESFRAKAGVAQERRVKKVTWYVDPPSVAPGIYAAVDHESHFAKTHLVCGFVVWKQQSNGSFLLQREEVNVIDRESAAKLSPEQLAVVRRKYRC